MKTYEPILLAERRRCAYPECKQQTLWMRPGQRSLGTCLDHMVPHRTLTRSGERLARDVVFSSFPATDVLAAGELPRPADRIDETVRVVVGGTWVRLDAAWRVSVDVRPLDAGPCCRCGKLIRHAYGAYANVTCRECEAA